MTIDIIGQANETKNVFHNCSKKTNKIIFNRSKVNLCEDDEILLRHRLNKVSTLVRNKTCKPTDG